MYHFSSKDGSLRYGDKRKIVAGETLTVKYEPILCEQGLHASNRITDALIYAPDFMLWKVELSGNVIHGHDKSVATERKAIWGFYARDVIFAWSRRVALDALIKYWDCSKWGAIDPIISEFLLTGENGSNAVNAANAAVTAVNAAMYDPYNRRSDYHAARAAYFAANAARDAALAAAAVNAIDAIAFVSRIIADADTADAVVAYAEIAEVEAAKAKAWDYAYHADSAAHAVREDWLVEMVIEALRVDEYIQTMPSKREQHLG